MRGICGRSGSSRIRRRTAATRCGPFWFDITKADWRDTMVLQVPSRHGAATTRRCTRFDLLQQFGWAGPLLAAAGLAALARTNRRRAALLVAAYLVNVLFAFSYNVGDAHVFFLPSHLMFALLAAPGPVVSSRAELARRSKRASRGDSPRRRGCCVSRACGLALIGYAGLRIYRDYPALDRSDDRRPATVLSALTAGIDDRHAILLTDLNWQVQNGLSYYASHERPEVAYARLADVLLYAPGARPRQLRHRPRRRR